MDDFLYTTDSGVSRIYYWKFGPVQLASLLDRRLEYWTRSSIQWLMLQTVPECHTTHYKKPHHNNIHNIIQPHDMTHNTLKSYHLPIITTINTHTIQYTNTNYNKTDMEGHTVIKTQHTKHLNHLNTNTIGNTTKKKQLHRAWRNQQQVP